MTQATQLTGWFEAYAAPLVLYARQWLARPAAEDIVQEAFVRLMLQKNPPDNVRAWLYRAVRNLAISQWRSTQRRLRLEESLAREEQCFEPPGGESLDAQAAAEAMRDLPPVMREIIVMRIWGQLKLAEIASITEMPLSSVFYQYQQGLAEIRKRMGVPCRNSTY
jgi:RNA polymerase sigma-70 factor (ECF subfamily)